MIESLEKMRTGDRYEFLICIYRGAVKRAKDRGVEGRREREGGASGKGK
jgi:hypothetical protein